MSIENQINPPAAQHGEAVAGRAAAVRRELLKLNSSIEDMSFDLAELLHETKQGALYSAWGFKTFEDYVTDELDMKLSRAYYLKRIVQVCTACGVERLTYQPVGLSKLREITRLDPEGSYFNQDTKESEPLRGHIQRLIGIAKDMTREQIVEEVKRLLGLVGDEELVFDTCSYKRVVKDNVIIPARELAKQKMGSAGRDEKGDAIEYSDSAAEEVIHQDYLNSPDSYAEEPDESQEQVEENSEPPATDIRI